LNVTTDGEQLSRTMTSAGDAQLRAQVLGAVAREPSPTRGQRRRRSTLLYLAAAAAGVLVFFLYGGVRPHDRPLSLLLGTVSGSALLAACGLWIALGRGRSMLGRSRLLLAATVAFLPLALLAWKLGVSALFEGMSGAWPARPGFRCFALSLAVGLAPLAAALATRRRTDPLHPGSAGAAIGAACGLAAAALVDLWCPVAHLPHLLLGHLLPVALFALAGAALGARLLALRFHQNR
jgi:hypothetical protein